MRPTVGTSNTGVQSSAPAASAEATRASTSSTAMLVNHPVGPPVTGGEPVTGGVVAEGLETQAKGLAVEGLGLFHLGGHQLRPQYGAGISLWNLRWVWHGATRGFILRPHDYFTTSKENARVVPGHHEIIREGKPQSSALATPTMAGRRQRSPMAKPDCISCTTVPGGYSLVGI